MPRRFRRKQLVGIFPCNCSFWNIRKNHPPLRSNLPRGSCRFLGCTLSEPIKTVLDGACLWRAPSTSQDFEQSWEDFPSYRSPPPHWTALPKGCLPGVAWKRVADSRLKHSSSFFSCPSCPVRWFSSYLNAARKDWKKGSDRRTNYIPCWVNAQVSLNQRNLHSTHRQPMFNHLASNTEFRLLLFLQIR